MDSEDEIDDITKEIAEKLKKYKFSGSDVKGIGGSSKREKREISKPTKKWDSKEDFYTKIKDLESEEKIEEYEKQIKNDFENLELWIEYGRELRRAGRYEESLMAYNTALMKDPRNRLALQGKGYTLQRLERWSDSIKCFEKILKDDPDNVDALLERGYSTIQLSDSDKYEKAIEYYDRVIKIDERQINALENLGFCYFRKREYDTAIKYLQRSIAIEDEDDNYAKRFLARCYFEKDSNEKCEEICDELIKSKTKDSYVYYMKGWLLNDSEKYSEAIVHLKNGLKQKKLAGILQSLGYAHLQLKKYELSKMYYENSLEIDDTNEVSFANLGWCNYRENDYESAIKYCSDSLKIAPDYTYPLEAKLLSLKKLGKDEEIVNTIRKLEDVNGGPWEKSWVVCSLYEALFRLERWDECLDEIDNANEIDEGNDSRIVRNMLWKAATLRELKKSDDAIKILDDIINDDPGNWDAYRIKGDIFEKLDKLDEALESYNKSGWILKNLEKEKQDLGSECEALVDKARVLKMLGRKPKENDKEKMQKAIEILDLAI